MWISELVWTDADVAHIGRHGISPDEVEEVLAAGPVWRRGRTHRPTGRTSLYALGQTEGGRHLFVVLSPLGKGRARCVTAMAMDAKARRYYDRHKREGEWDVTKLTTRRRVPVFRTDEEERAFWETHRPGDYVSTMTPARVQVSGRLRERVKERKKNLTLRMEPSRVQEIKAVAHDMGVPYQTLMRMWIVERLRRERAG